MTTLEFEQYKIAVRSAYKDYIVDLYNKAQVTELNLQYEFDTKVWILGKCISVVFSFDFDEYNKWTIAEFKQWQNIMNNIMKTRLYVNFISE